MTKTIDRSTFLTPIDPKLTVVEIPEMGGKVYVKGFTAAQRSVFETSMQDGKGKVRSSRKQKIRELLIVKCVCDETGTLMFTEADLDIIGRQPATVLEPLVEQCMIACGLMDADMEKLGNDSEEITESS